MRRPRLWSVLLLSLALAWPTAAQAEEDPTTLSLTGPARVQLTSSATMTATLSTTDTAIQVAGVTVVLQRRTASGWKQVDSAITDDSGSAQLSGKVVSATTAFRATAALPSAALLSSPVEVIGFRRASTLELRGTWRVVDGHRRSLTVTWRADNGAAVPGTARVYERFGKRGQWRRVRRVDLGADGRALIRVAPRRDSYWKVAGSHGPWWQHATSAVNFLDNLPPGIPVRYPAGAPRPERLPAQRHASGKGAHPVVGRVPDKVWRSMVGRSWHRSCPVGRSHLRLLRINYWDFAGYRRRGEMVLRDFAARRAASALAAMYRNKLPLRAMYRVDRFGWSRYLHGGNDYASMRHDNSYAFNCRGVTGNPSVLSPHSYGTAVDLNTWENPYHSARGIVPDTWWAHHSAPRITWRSPSAAVVRIWRAHGFHWTYGNADSQHFDGRVTSSARRTPGGTPATGTFVFAAD